MNTHDDIRARFQAALNKNMLNEAANRGYQFENNIMKGITSLKDKNIQIDGGTAGNNNSVSDLGLLVNGKPIAAEIKLAPTDNLGALPKKEVEKIQFDGKKVDYKIKRSSIYYDILNKALSALNRPNVLKVLKNIYDSIETYIDGSLDLTKTIGSLRGGEKEVNIYREIAGVKKQFTGSGDVIVEPEIIRRLIAKKKGPNGAQTDYIIVGNNNHKKVEGQIYHLGNNPLDIDVPEFNPKGVFVEMRLQGSGSRTKGTAAFGFGMKTKNSGKLNKGREFNNVRELADIFTRARFNAQMENYTSINESNSIKELETLAQTASINAKRKLFDKINTIYFNGKAPFGDPIEITEINQRSIQKVWSKIKKASKSDQGTLFGIKKDGIGSGEIMMAYLVKNMIIGGGSADVDLNLFDLKKGQGGMVKIIDKAELKEAKLSRDGYLRQWRTGTKHRGIITKAVEDLKDLYMTVRNDIQALDPTTDQGKVIAKKALNNGEWAGVVKHVKDLESIQSGSKLDFTLDFKNKEGGEIVAYYQGDKVGKLSDAKTLDKIKNIFKQNSTSVKSFNQIEKEVAKGFGAIKGKFVFIQTSGSNKETGEGKKNLKAIFYKDNLPNNNQDLKIDEFTQNSMKIKVKA